MSIQNASRRIYVASLSDYNNGSLHGVWIDVDGKDEGDLQSEVDTMLRTSKFPNVLVTCGGCAGHGHISVGVQPQIDCPECRGAGEVPSAEEWAIHDHEGFGDALGESSSLEEVVELAERLEEHGEAWLAYLDDVGTHYATEGGFNEAYQGTFNSPEEWAENFADETGLLESVPENLRCYFDFEAYARDARLNGDVSFVERDGSTFVFWNH